jgi:hypothetical protein
MISCSEIFIMNMPFICNKNHFVIIVILLMSSNLNLL